MTDFEISLHIGESSMRACRLSKSLVVRCTLHTRTRARSSELLHRSQGRICGPRCLLFGGVLGKWPQLQAAQLVHA